MNMSPKEPPEPATDMEAVTLEPPAESPSQEVPESERPAVMPTAAMPRGAIPLPLQQMLMGAPKPPPERIYVSFSAEIMATTTEALIALLSKHVNDGVKEVYLMLSTPGGTVMNGMNLYNVLRALPVKLITHNMGNVDSIGNAVFLAGQERYACRHSTFMFHGVGVDLPSGTRLEEKFLRERLNGVMADQKRIGSIIGERTNLKGRQIMNLFKEARTKDADYARRVGIVHDILDATIPVGAPIFSLVFPR
jgi:ATP-dependent Clp protease, protease subunit